MIVKIPPESPQDLQLLEKTLRPTSWEDFIGQERVKSTLSVIIEAAKKRKEALEHLLFYGNSGLGKTSLAHVVANTMGVSMKRSAGPALQSAGDVASLLSNLQDGEVLFIDEIHRVNKSVVEMLYSAMEDFALHLVLGKGPMARTMELDLPHFTLIGATTKIGLLPSPFRNRFGATFQLGFYAKQDMESIVRRSSQILRTSVDEDALYIIAERSRYTPRVANRILKRVRDFALVRGNGVVTKEIALDALRFLEIDELGLEPDDRKMLKAIIQKFGGGPVGIDALAAASSEEIETVLDIYEPYLLQLGFIERTPRGRIATKKAYEHLGLAKPQSDLL